MTILSVVSTLFTSPPLKKFPNQSAAKNPIDSPAAREEYVFSHFVASTEKIQGLAQVLRK
jgi:hypothetical protein